MKLLSHVLDLMRSIFSFLGSIKHQINVKNSSVHIQRCEKMYTEFLYFILKIEQFAQLETQSVP